LKELAVQSQIHITTNS